MLSKREHNSVEVAREHRSHRNRTKKLLDNFRHYPYHSTEAIIYLQSVQIKRQKTQCTWRLMFNFLHYVQLMSL